MSSGSSDNNFIVRLLLIMIAIREISATMMIEITTIISIIIITVIMIFLSVFYKLSISLPSPSINRTK